MRAFLSMIAFSIRGVLADANRGLPTISVFEDEDWGLVIIVAHHHHPLQSLPIPTNASDAHHECRIVPG